MLRSFWFYGWRKSFLRSGHVYFPEAIWCKWHNWDLNLGGTGSNLSCYYCAVCLSKMMSLYLLLAAHFIVTVLIHSLHHLVGGLLYSNPLACYLLDLTEGSWMLSNCFPFWSLRTSLEVCSEVVGSAIWWVQIFCLWDSRNTTLTGQIPGVPSYGYLSQDRKHGV